MQISGYRLKRKFPNFIEYNTFDAYETINENICPAFLIFHGPDDELDTFYANNKVLINDGQIAVLGISEGILKLPTNCKTNYLHCLSYSIKNNCLDKIILDKFVNLLEKVQALSSLPSTKDEMDKLWLLVDDNYNELDKIMLDDLSPILIYGPEWAKNIDMVELVKSYYGEPILNHEELKNSLIGIAKKTGFTTWNNNIRRLNHNVFHHEFYHHFASQILKKHLSGYITGDEQQLDSDILAIFKSWGSICQLFNNIYLAPEANCLSENDTKRLALDTAKSNMDWISKFIDITINNKKYDELYCHNIPLIDTFLDHCDKFSKNLSSLTHS